MRRRVPIGLLAVAVVASAALLFSLTANLTFVGDPWGILIGRPDWSLSTFLEPWNEHPIVLPALVYKALLTLFGMDSAFPFYVVSISLFLLCGVLLFVYLKRRVGDWAALAGAVLVLFLGAAYEDLLWEFQMSFFGSMAAGLGALIALDREDRAGDRAAAALLLVATASSTLGVPFIFAALARVLLDAPLRIRRLYVPLLPLAAYALWWLVAGHTAGGQLGLAEIPKLPFYVFEVAAGGLASLLGRLPIDGDAQPPLLAKLLVLLLAAAVTYRFARLRRIPRGLLVALVLLFSFWLLIALDRGPQRFSSRFQYPSAVFILIFAAESLRGQRLSRPVIAALAVVTAAAVLSGISLLEWSQSHKWKPRSDQTRAVLAAVDIAGPAVQPGFRVSLQPSVLVPVEKYLGAKRKHGTPAFSAAQLLRAHDTAAAGVADATLLGAMGVRLQEPQNVLDQASCHSLRPEHRPVTEARLSPPAAIRIDNRSQGEVELGMRRFSTRSSVRLGDLAAGQAAELRLPADRSQRPWRLVMDGPVRLCRLR